MDDPAHISIRNEMRLAVEALKDRIDERFDMQAETSKERHSENVVRLTRIEQEVHTTNGRVTRHDEQIRAIIGGWRGPRGDKGDKGDKGDAVTLDNIKWYILIALSCIGGTVTVLEFLGKIK